MKFVHRAVLPMAPGAAFERLRAFARLYPAFHPAHDPHPPGAEPPLLSPGCRFSLGERFGLERRRYRFEVEAYEPQNGYIRLLAHTRTRWGPIAVRSTLLLAFSLESAEGGTALTVTQTVSFGRGWLDRLLDRPWLWRSVEAHAAEECAAAFRLLSASEAA